MSNWISRLLRGLSRSRSIAAQRPAPGVWRATPDFGPHGFMAVRGESFHQESLHRLMASSRSVFTAVLRAEPTNPVDPNAVLVTIEPVGAVGHLPRDVAKQYCRLVTAHHEGIRCPAQLVGGTETKPSIGVVLDFIDVDKMKAAQTAVKR
jgi:hypothetical protein